MKRVISMCAAVAVVLAAAVSCCNKAPKVAEAIPFPKLDTTPPNIKMYFVILPFLSTPLF